MVFFDYAVLLLLGTAAGCGIGGGGLLVVYLTLVYGTEQTTAQAVNLLFFLIAALISAVVQSRNGSSLSLRTVTFCALCAVPGVFLGSRIRSVLSLDSLRSVFGVILILTGITVFFRQFRQPCRRFLRRLRGKHDEMAKPSKSPYRSSKSP